MKHEKTWRTCDRCGKEIDYTGMALRFQKKPSKLIKRPNCPAMKELDLCGECTEKFEKFMKNEHS